MRNTAIASSRNSWWSQAIHNRLIAVVLAMVVIVPLVAGPVEKNLFGAGALAFESFAVLLAAVLMWRARWDMSREKVVSFVRTGANLPVVALMGLAVVSAIVAPSKVFALQGLLQLGAGVLLYFVVGYQFRQSKHLSMLVDTLLFVAATMSLVTMAQYVMDSSNRGTAMFGNQQPLGSMLMILLPIVAVIALADKSPRRQLVAQAITVMTAGSLLLAHTRSAWLGAFAGAIVLGALALRSASADSKLNTPAAGRGLATQKHKFVMPLVMGVVSLGFVAAMVTQNSQLTERAATLANASQDRTLVQREVLWNGAASMIKSSPIIGHGIGQYATLQKAYTGVGNNVATKVGGEGGLADQAHNFYLQTGAELGLLGLALTIAVMVAFVVTAVRRLPSMDAGIRRALLMGSVASVVAFSVDAMSSPTWQFGQFSMFLWLIMGAGVSCLRPRVRHEEETVVAPVARPRFVRPLSVVGAALIMIMVVLPTVTIAATPATYVVATGNNDIKTSDVVEAVGATVFVAYLIDTFIGGGEEVAAKSASTGSVKSSAKVGG